LGAEPAAGPFEGLLSALVSGRFGEELCGTL
jgi:hypothetical protein